MVAMLEMSGVAAMRVHLLVGALLLSRLLHPLGKYAAPSTLQFRIGAGPRHYDHVRFIAGLRPHNPVARDYWRLIRSKSLRIQRSIAIALNFDTVKILLDACRVHP